MQDEIKIRNGVLQSWNFVEIELQGYKELETIARALVLLCIRITLEARLAVVILLRL